MPRHLAHKLTKWRSWTNSATSSSQPPSQTTTSQGCPPSSAATSTTHQTSAPCTSNQSQAKRLGAPHRQTTLSRTSSTSTHSRMPGCSTTAPMTLLNTHDGRARTRHTEPPASTSCSCHPTSRSQSSRPRPGFTNTRIIEASV
ncbi:hypothetical protein CAOG_08880 [Capsaspora owczarzaki ATCC 30864]|uniref:hypothetical protein n=1 Tax=Capsaspora owczarzaki (strain ATCC 30864) TaxID=595528 RepID=UPI0003521197|nr:hypothetical protein CAOG_08880 [Capsaspora owczarzaki ATCC 30864]|eukprot:XP_011270542.1 hypothetical protein CAOG_08880 [Capsaspora owczarzaki ATCC 30864]